MPIKKITIPEFLEKTAMYPLLDVRSPGEYTHAHLPGALSLPLFTDEERKIVGTAYKQQGKQIAIKLGLDFFGVKMKGMVEEVEKIIAAHSKEAGKYKEARPLSGGLGAVLLHCWRGGMRSAGVAWLLDLYGYEVYTLAGGYKAYRSWVLLQFEKDYDCKILGGYTGSGKTDLLKQLQKNNQPVLDLEGLANHKGSAFGALGQPLQPTQEMFENILAIELNKLQQSNFYIEDESQRIGVLNIPNAFWKTMRTKPVYFMDIPFEQRLAYITTAYGCHDKEKLVNAIIRIQKRLGPLETKTAIGFLIENNHRESFKILLHYYDKHYLKGLNNRENISVLLNKIECSSVDTISNTEKILRCATVNV
ncbi:MAG: tRNA 2-selenouridine(34) synthase MnmH [Ferruginibacter sp.]